jgi:hypothetical protein
MHKHCSWDSSYCPNKTQCVKDPSVEFVKSRLLGAAAEAKFARDPKIYSLAVTLKIADVSRKDTKYPINFLLIY